MRIHKHNKKEIVFKTIHLCISWFTIFVNNHLHINKIQNNTITNWEECGPCPIFVSYTLAFALQLRKKHRKTSVRVEYTEQSIHNKNTYT